MLAAIKAADPARYTKSSIMVGLGETDEEVITAMGDLRAVGTDFLTRRAVPQAQQQAPGGGGLHHAGAV